MPVGAGAQEQACRPASHTSPHGRADLDGHTEGQPKSKASWGEASSALDTGRCDFPADPVTLALDRCLPQAMMHPELIKAILNK